MNRTGSMGSCVGPAVTTTVRPARSRSRPTALSTARKTSSGSLIRPRPSSPAAREPVAGPTITAPRAASVRRCSWVAGCSYIPVCMAGATTSGHLASSSVDVTMSSARPRARRAITFAVAGATTATSASCARRTCRTRSGSSKTSVRAFRPVRPPPALGSMSASPRPVWLLDALLEALGALVADLAFGDLLEGDGERLVPQPGVLGQRRHEFAAALAELGVVRVDLAGPFGGKGHEAELGVDGREEVVDLRLDHSVGSFRFARAFALVSADFRSGARTVRV